MSNFNNNDIHHVPARALAVLLGVILGLLALAAPASAAEEETPPTNLSFPAIWSEGIALAAPYTEPPTFTGAFTELEGVKWYHQKDEGNVWQADTLDAAAEGIEGVDVSTVDWGDNLEAKSWNVGQQVRVETVLYKALSDPEIAAALGGETMTAYTMEQTNAPTKGPEEMWGADGTTYESPEATVYSGCAVLTIQRLRISRDDPAVSLLKWDSASGQWTGSELIAPPLFKGGVWEGGEGTGGYSAEINIKGVTIYGYNWSTSGIEQGHYRLTFSLDPNCPVGELNTFITNDTTVAVSEEEGTSALAGPVTAAEPEAGGGEGRIDGANNLTYIDVQIGNPSYPPYVPPTEEEGTTGGAANQAPAAASVKTRERTRMRITLRARQSQVTEGGIAVLEGTAAPARNGARVTLQQRTRTRSGKVVFLNVKSVRLRKHTEERSRFVFRVRARHTATYRALVPGNGDYLKSTSAPVRVQVGP